MPRKSKTISLYEDLKKTYPDLDKWTFDDLEAERCRLQASVEDSNRRHAELYREQGFVAVEDSSLMLKVWGALRPVPETLSEAMEVLRRRKRRGHLQQQALDTYDAYYANGRRRFPDNHTIDRLETLFDRLEETRERATGRGVTQ